MSKVKVRIAVAVDPSGKWNAVGGTWAETAKKDPEGYDKEAMGLAVECMEDGEARYWLMAELDVPEAEEVAAEVEKAA